MFTIQQLMEKFNIKYSHNVPENLIKTEFYGDLDDFTDMVIRNDVIYISQSNFNNDSKTKFYFAIDFTGIDFEDISKFDDFTEDNYKELFKEYLELSSKNVLYVYDIMENGNIGHLNTYNIFGGRNWE